MRVAVLRWNVEAAYGTHTVAATFLTGKGVENVSSARPARDASRIQRSDIGRESADEVVIERSVVILDDSNRKRRRRCALPGKVGGEIRTSRRIAEKCIDAVGRQRGISPAIHTGVIERAAVGRHE